MLSPVIVQNVRKRSLLDGKEVESEAILDFLAVVSIQVESMRIERLTRSNSVRYLRKQIRIYIDTSSRVFSPATRRVDFPYE